MAWLFFLVALATGAANPLQSGANAELNKQLGTPVWAGIVVYVTGLSGMLLAQLVMREALPNSSRMGAVTWWAWLGGLISIASTMAGLTLAQKLGSGLFTGLSITAAILMSLLLDQFGWAGFRLHPASPARLAGAALMVAGLWLVARY